MKVKRRDVYDDSESIGSMKDFIASDDSEGIEIAKMLKESFR